MDVFLWLAPILAICALLFAAYKAHYVSSASPGNERMQEIAGSIAEGANAFLKSEYKILAIFIVVLFVLISIFIDIGTGICFVIGAVFSILAGFFGMRVATKANVRTANAAKESGMIKALSIAFSGGSVMGMCVVGLGLLGCSLIYILTGNYNILFCLPVLAAVSIPRPLTLVPTWSVRLRLASLRMTPVTLLSSPITWAITWATWPVWALTCLKAMSAL
jgi:K(+)-stimulated pyrophosphate-energized sodium pump